MGPICNNRATNKEFVPPSALFPEILLFGTQTLSGAEQERRVLWEALRFVAEPGRFVISSLVTPPSLSHFPSFSDGQGHRQALQLPRTLALQGYVTGGVVPWKASSNA